MIIIANDRDSHGVGTLKQGSGSSQLDRN